MTLAGVCTHTYAMSMSCPQRELAGAESGRQGWSERLDCLIVCKHCAIVRKARQLKVPALLFDLFFAKWIYEHFLSEFWNVYFFISGAMVRHCLPIASWDKNKFWFYRRICFRCASMVVNIWADIDQHRVNNIVQLEKSLIDGMAILWMEAEEVSRMIYQKTIHATSVNNFPQTINYKLMNQSFWPYQI